MKGISSKFNKIFSGKKKKRVTDEWEIEDPNISVVGERFCNPYKMQLVVKRERESLKKDRFDVFDSSGNLLFTVDGNIWDSRRRRLMRDAAGLPVLSIRMSSKGLHKYKWEVKEGESREGGAVLFTVQEPNLLALKTAVDVFLPDPSSSTHPVSPDFHAVGSFVGSSFKLLKSNSLLAKVVHDNSLGKMIKGNYNFRVTIYPNVDYAFVVALVVIVDDLSNLQ